MECECCDHVLPAAAYFVRHLQHLGYAHVQLVDELRSLLAYESRILQQLQPFLCCIELLLDISGMVQMFKNENLRSDPLPSN